MFWQSIVNSTNPADFEAYLRRFPDGVFSELAQNRLSALGGSVGGPRAPTSRPTVAAANSVSADPVPRIRADETCARRSADYTSCWMEVSQRAGCYAWNRSSVEDQTVTWTGACADGFAQGTGTLTWAIGAEYRDTGTGRLVDGKYTDHWVHRIESRYVAGTSEGPYVDGERHGHWVIRKGNGTVEEGPYVRGQKHGHWVEDQKFFNTDLFENYVREGSYVNGRANGHWVYRKESGTVEEGPYVDDLRNGHWVIRQANGNVEEGPFVDGKENGHWVIRHADGEVQEGPFVDGKHNGRWVIRRATGTVEEHLFEDGEHVRRVR